MKYLIILLSLSSQISFAQNFESTDFKVVSFCNEENYIDIIPSGSTFTILTEDTGYTPKCLRIKKGTTIEIQASTTHPLQGIPESSDPIINPIYDTTGDAVTSKTVTFNDTGVFGYYCTVHGNANGEGMAGAVLVID
jgi:plastocyanin